MLLAVYVILIRVFQLWEESFICINEETILLVFPFITFIHELIEKRGVFFFLDETKVSLLSSVDFRGVSWASTLLYHACNHAWCFPSVSGPFGKSLEQKWKYCSYCCSSRWGPQSRMDPSLPKDHSAGAVSLPAWPALPGESQGCVSQRTQPGAGADAPGLGGLCWIPSWWATVIMPEPQSLC